MSEPIKVGDLVVVVRADRCCGDETYLGRVYRVSGFRRTTTACLACGHRFRAEQMCLGDSVWHPTKSVKRIPPLEELEGENRKEELTA